MEPVGLELWSFGSFDASPVVFGEVTRSRGFDQEKHGSEDVILEDLVLTVNMVCEDTSRASTSAHSTDMRYFTRTGFNFGTRVYLVSDEKEKMEKIEKQDTREQRKPRTVRRR